MFLRKKIIKDRTHETPETLEKQAGNKSSTLTTSKIILLTKTPKIT